MIKKYEEDSNIKRDTLWVASFSLDQTYSQYVQFSIKPYELSFISVHESYRLIFSIGKNFDTRW